MKDTAAEIIAKAETVWDARSSCPPTSLWPRNSKATREHQVLPADQCPEEGMILDAGPDSVARDHRDFWPQQDRDLERPAGRV